MRQGEQLQQLSIPDLILGGHEAVAAFALGMSSAAPLVASGGTDQKVPPPQFRSGILVSRNLDCAVCYLSPFALQSPLSNACKDPMGAHLRPIGHRKLVEKLYVHDCRC